MRKVLLALMLLLEVFTFSACYDANEVDDMTYVLAVGIDKGVSDKWRLTLQFPSMQGQTGSSSGTGGVGTSSSGGKSGYDVIRFCGCFSGSYICIFKFEEI